MSVEPEPKQFGTIQERALYAGRHVMKSIAVLKSIGGREGSHQSTFCYMLDEKFDVEINVKLLNKKSQLQHGMEMLGVKTCVF